MNTPSSFSTHLRRGFTLVELVVAMGVMALLMVMIGQLFNMALVVTTMRDKQMDSDSQARAVFNRMAIDFAQMVKRPDVDYYLKSSLSDPYTYTNPQSGSGVGMNDQMAFYSQVPGYNPSTSGQSPVSLVAWRVNADSSGGYYNQLQRLGYGLDWNGFSTTAVPVVFSTAGTYGPSTTATPNNAIYNNWPAATDPKDPNNNYELAGPQVFRMEYYYLLKGQTSPTGTPFTPQLSDTPWEARVDTSGTNKAFHTSVSGLRDVAAITVIIAVADPKSRLLVTPSQLATLAGKMNDFPATDANGNNTAKPGDLEAQWQGAINDPTNGIARMAAPSLRVYQRTFYLPSNLTPSP
jgi:prepilin-type N-terminal cleavage/methylation domain-containing protein